MAQRISELQRLRNELAQLKSPTQDNLSQSDINIPKDSAQKNTGSGFGYTLGKLWGGIVRSHEGWFDAAIAQAADIFGNDELAERVMKNDWMDYGKYDAKFNPGKGWEFTGDVASGVGNMIPAIALSFVPGAGAGLSQGWFMQSASGQAVSDAVKETGELGNKEWVYGTASGLLEGAIEKMSGGIGGTALFKDIGKKAGKTVLGKLAVNMAGEGAEEVASDIIDPILKRTTGVDNEAEMPTFGELGRTFAVGGVTGAVMGGVKTALQAAKVGGFNTLNAINDSNELVERQADNNLRQTEGKKALYTEEDINRTMESLSKRLKKMDDTQRKMFLEHNANISSLFEADGSVKQENPFAESVSGESYNTNSYSASLKGREGDFIFKPVSIDTEVGEHSKKAMDTLTRLTKGKANIVLTDEMITTESGAKANGLYKDGIIYLDANASDYKNAITVGSHEVIHSLEGTDAYNELGKYIAERLKADKTLGAKYNYDKYRYVYDAILEDGITEGTKDYQAVTEIFADFMANEVLKNEDSMRRLTERDANIIVKLYRWVKNAISRLGNSEEDRKVKREMRKLEELLAKALNESHGGISLDTVEEQMKSAEAKRRAEASRESENAPQNGKLATARASLSSISNQFFGEELTVEEFEKKDYKQTEEYKKYVNECLSNMKQTRENFSEKDSRKEIEDSIDGIVKLAVAMKKAGYDILDDRKQRDTKDSKGRKLFSSLEPNSDYFTSHDISTICDKRKNFTEIYEEIVRREEEAKVPKGKRFFDNVDNYFYLHDVMAEFGLTTACRQCYVESMRKNLFPMANAFLELVQETNSSNKANKQLFDKNGNPKATNTRLRDNVLKAFEDNEYSIKVSDLNEEMLTTADGLAQLKLQAPLVYEAFNSFYGQAKPKMPKKATPFRFGDLTALLTDENGKIKEGLVDRINKTGGFRLQSYSDFQIENYADVLQVIFEAGTLGLTGHAYTKVPAFLDATANTNLKRNVSVFMYEHNGKWVVDKGDSFPATMEQLAKIVEADKSGNTGIIAVAQNESMAAYVMVNDDIAFFIPYHKSGMKMSIVRETKVKEGGKVIEGGYKNIKDHTRMQSETWKTTTDEHKRYTKVKKSIDIYSFWDFDNVDNLSKKDLIEKNVKRYIDECDKAGYYPKFRNYVMNNADVLKDTVKYAKELGIDADIDSLAFKYKGYTIPYGYYKCLGDFSMFKPNGEASPHEVLSLKNYKFDKAIEYFNNAEKLRRTEILQQIENGKMRQELADSDLTANQIDAIVKDLRKQATDKALKEKGYKKSTSRPSLDVNSVEDIESKYEPYTKYLNLNEGKDYIRIRNINVKEEYRNQGIGQKILDDVISYADSKRKTITLTPTKEFGTYARLKEWYTKNGFVYNAGKNADLSISDTMYRLPEKKTSRASLNVVDTFTPDQIDTVIDDITDMFIEMSEIDTDAYNVEIYGKRTLAKEFAELLNSKATTSTKKPAERSSELVNKVLDNVRITNADTQMVKDAKATIESLRKYYHSMNLQSVKADIHNEAIYRLFSGGENAMEWDSVLQEIVEAHPEYDMGNDIDTLLNVMDEYAKARKTINENRVPMSKVVKELNLVKDMMQKQLAVSLEGNSTKYNKVKKQSYAKSLDTNQAKFDKDLDEKTESRVQSVVQDKKKRSVQEVYDDVAKKLKEGEADRWIRSQIAFTDEQAGILLAGRNVGEILYGEVQRARSAKASAMNMLANEQRDWTGKKKVGDSLKTIFEPIHKKGEAYTKKFNLYLLHMLNIDRMTAVEKADAEIKKLYKANPNLKTVVETEYETEAQWVKAVKGEEGGEAYLRLIETKNKPVFQEEVSAEFSKEKVAQLEKANPEFMEYAKKVWNYSQNLLQYRVDAGLTTQELADQLKKAYPHYVPAFYEDMKNGTSGASLGKNGVAVRSGIKTAQGSKGVSNINDISLSLTKQTVAVVRAATINQVARKLYDGAERTQYHEDVEAVSREKMETADVDYDKELPKDNQVFFYLDGERITLNVTEYVFAGFEGLTAKAEFKIPALNTMEKAIKLFKSAVTSYNPTFTATNAIRDLWEAFWYTKYGAFKFLGRYTKSLFRMNNPKMRELWQQYVALGGMSSSYYYTDKTGIYDARSKFRKGATKVLDVIDAANDFVEQTPRFAEFVASVEAGNSLEQALYDSAEVTTNFSRGGRLTKKLNRCLIPFLNPSVQGWSKLWRSWASPMEKLTADEIRNASKSAKNRMILSRYGVLAIKAVTVGMAVGLFNDLLYRFLDDDEDYENIPLNIKENYFLIKIGKKFLKIPKGRVMALYGSMATRIVEYKNGNEKALDVWDWGKSASEMVSPIESASRTIFAPILQDVRTNTTWYGGKIENESMQNLAPEDRYDESTSSIAVAIGKALNYSPKKIHYLIDQYTGVVGDIILPATTNKTEKDMFSSRFIVDATYNNDLSTKFYDYKEELTFAKNGGDVNAKLMLKYMNEVSDSLSEMYQQKRDIANDSSLSNKEKREQTDITQSLINGTLSSAMDVAEKFEQALIDNKYEQAVAVLTSSKAYTKLDEKSQTYASNKMNEYYYEMCKAEVSGTKPSMKYALYTSMNAPDLVVYLSNINNIEADKDKKGNTISGSRKEKVHKYIQGLRLSTQQKNILMYLAGYKPTDAGQKTVEAYLTKQGYTAKEVDELWSN